MLSLKTRTGEIDGLRLCVDEEDQELPAGKRLDVTFVTALHSPCARRRSLRAIVDDVTTRAGLPLRLIPFANLQQTSFSPVSCLRLIVDLWTNSSERELRDTASMTYSLFRTIGKRVPMDILACVYPARANRRTYLLLSEAIRMDESDIHSITHSPRVMNVGDTFHSGNGLQASLYSFLSV